MCKSFGAFLLLALSSIYVQAGAFKQTDTVFMTVYIKSTTADPFIDKSCSLRAADLLIMDINTKTPHCTPSAGGLTTQVTIVGNIANPNPVNTQNLHYGTYEVGWNGIGIHMISG